MKLFQKNPQVKKPKPAMLTLQKHLSPKEIETKLDYIKINSQYNRIVSANGYPRTIREGWLNKIIC
ncbi:MAG: hypothetical protein Q7K42_04550, partial [Candidatus Diapherotrites archaeon]|nr:hypothetical protein [Candidatus Diapherotrites archaeon]